MKPFRDYDLSDAFSVAYQKIDQKIDKLTNDEIMANDLELLADNLYEEFYIQPVKIFDEDPSKRKVVQGKVRRYVDPFFRDRYGREYVDVDGVILTFAFPYEGEEDLFRCRASTFSVSGYPDIDVSKTHVAFHYEKTLQEIESGLAKDGIMASVERDLSSIRQGIVFCNNDVSSFNSGLKDGTIKRLQQKKEKVEAYFSVASMFEVPLQKTPYAESHIAVRRKIAPISHTYDKKPIYCITDRDYNDILSTIKHTGCTYERTPASYKSLHEEDLRNTLLAALNASYMGDAFGEAFRNNGKTDICIERENRAAFVAECKMWTGQKEVGSALTQLDSYLTWRDCKTALIYFVNRKDYLKIVDTLEDTLKTLPAIRQVQKIDRNEFKCHMISESNPGQLVQVRVMLFNLFAK